MTRAQTRALFSDPLQRVTLLEADVDDIEKEMHGLRDEVRAQSRILMGVLVAVSTGAIIGAINIVLQAS